MYLIDIRTNFMRATGLRFRIIPVSDSLNSLDRHKHYQLKKQAKKNMQLKQV